MRLPRDIGGEQLVQLLGKFGYKVTRQTGSHIRLSSKLKDEEHHLTIPNHSPLKIGTLNSIVNSAAEYLKISKQEVINKLFS